MPRLISRCAAICLPWLLLHLSACGNKPPHEPSDLVDVHSRVKLDEIWSTFLPANQTHQFRVFAPLLDGDDLYVAVQSGYLYKFTLVDGAPRRAWRVNLHADIYSGVSVYEDTVYACAGEGQLALLSGEDGSLTRTIDLSSHCVAPPLLDGERIYLRLADGTVIAHDGDRKVLWTYSQGLVSLSLDGNSPLLLHNNSLFFGADTSKLHSLSPKKGDPYWSVNVGIPETYTEIGLILDIDAPLEAWGNYLIVSAYQGRILMINSLTGRQIWELDVSTRTGVLIDEASELGWVADSDGVVHCFELGSGNILWSSDILKYRTISRPVRINDAMVFADRFGYLHIFSAADGNYLGRGRIEVSRTERDALLKRYIRGRYQRKFKQTHLFSVWDDIFVSQDLSGRLVFYQLEQNSP